MLPAGKSAVAAIAVDGSSNSKTNGYAMSVNAASGSTLSYDLNGNMLSDGTNSYSWNAENRMTKITYPGTNNFSTFVYDGLRRTAKITETVAGSVTTTRQFVWSELSMREERDASGALTKKFFDRGQMNSVTKLFYDLDHLGSVRELADNSGAIQAQYAFDPFGQVTRLSESIPSDLGYGYYYLHSRSSLNLALYRSYSSLIGRWLNRDPIEEQGGNNLFAYVANKPMRVADPLGLQGIGMIPMVPMVPAVPMVPSGPMAAGGPPGGGQPSPGCMKLCWAWFIMCQERCIQQFIKDRDACKYAQCLSDCATDHMWCVYDCRGGRN
ncbi:hypothetical protein BH10CYA1_BH10CYA1_58440 [soil metagenome]